MMMMMMKGVEFARTGSSSTSYIFLLFGKIRGKAEDAEDDAEDDDDDDAEDDDDARLSFDRSTLDKGCTTVDKG